MVTCSIRRRAPRGWWAAAVVGLVGLGAAPRPAAEAMIVFIDLQPRANQKLSENFHSPDPPGNDLSSLPQGEQTLADVRFKVGEGLVQLGSSILESKPEKVEGLKVGRKVKQLHFLHGTGYGGGPDGSEFFVADGTLIGQYQVNYTDKTTATVPVVYGEDVRDWWVSDNGKDEVSRGKVAWKGENQASKANQCSLRLYLATWKNPHPDREVEALVFSSNKTRAAPFLIALSAEE